MKSIVRCITNRRYCKYYTTTTTTTTTTTSSSTSTNSKNDINTIFIDKLKTILGSSSILTDKDDDFKKYNIDWTKTFQGGKLICFPRNTNDISSVIKLCNKYNISIVPQGKIINKF